MKRNAKAMAALAVAASGLMLCETRVASATLLLGPVDTIYADNFSGATGTAIAGNVPSTETGLDGGSATSPWLGISTPASSGATDAVWEYGGSNSATITSPSAGIATSGTTMGEDANTIVNITLPVTPVMGYTYDLEATISGVNPALGGHGLEMAFLYNNGNGHITSAQAISNNDPAGLILYRDAAQTGPAGYFDIFENTGTGSDNRFAPGPGGSLTDGAVGQTVTVDILLSPLSPTSASMSWYLNGVAAATGVTVTGLTSGITDIEIGDNRIAGGTITGFSLTAVPEPASMALVSVAALALLKRKRVAASPTI
jgi:hypothetical protein